MYAVRLGVGKESKSRTRGPIYFSCTVTSAV
jgi:hypothetical protein